MKIKKLLATILATTLACGTIVGCGGGTADSSKSSAGGDTAKSGDGKVVRVFQLKVEINDALQELAKKYEEETGVKVEITSVGGGADYGASLKAEFAKGTEPDIFMIQGAGDYEVWKHKIDDLSNESWIKNAVNGTLDTVTVDGKVYGMPAATEGYGLMYNKSILDKAGIDPASITSFTKLKEAVEKLDSKKADLGIDDVFSYTTKETWVTGNHTFNIPFAMQDDPEKFADDYFAGKADVVNNKQFNDWMNLVELMCKYGGKEKLETIDDSEKSSCIPVGVPMYWVVNKDSKVNAEAKAFLTWMVESKEGQEAIVKNMDMIPAFTNFAVESDNALNKSISEFNKAGKTLPWTFTNFPDGFSMNNIGPVFSKFIKTDMGDAAKKQMLEDIQAATPVSK